IINSTVAHQENINHFDIEQLQIRLRHKLSGQKFILVLDDIWNDDRAKWIELSDLINVGAVESKIIVTTRSNSIASMMGTVPSYVLEGLSPENCLSLFVKWAFKNGEEEKYSNLVEIGKEIVRKCAGVPLAVKTLGSSLFSKYDLNKWIFIRNHEIWKLEQKKDDILPALKLSYDEMPSYLKQCFAYFSLYPKDSVFSISEIADIWIALGLVQSMNESENLQNIARDYINELLSRSLLQDFFITGNRGSFKVHDLIHDLALDFPGLLTLPEWIEGALETLETLLIYELPNLHTLKCLTTMIHLKRLDIIRCPQLLSLPSDIHCLTALEHLVIDECPVLCRKCVSSSIVVSSHFAHSLTLLIVGSWECGWLLPALHAIIGRRSGVSLLVCVVMGSWDHVPSLAF
ncbi:disease resistance protein rga2-like, partial [Trifolium pratense]